MKVILGVLMVLGGIVLGLYVGVWWAFIGGIVDIINEFKAAEVTSLNVATGVAKILFAGAMGWLSALVLIIPGSAIIQSEV